MIITEEFLNNEIEEIQLKIWNLQRNAIESGLNFRWFLGVPFGTEGQYVPAFISCSAFENEEK